MYIDLFHLIRPATSFHLTVCLKILSKAGVIWGENEISYLNWFLYGFRWNPVTYFGLHFHNQVVNKKDILGHNLKKKNFQQFL